MSLVIVSSVLAYLSTEIDDLLSLFILFGKAEKRWEKIAIVLGKYLGLALLAVCSAVFAHYLSKIPLQYVGFLGLVPFALGIKFAVDSITGKSEEDDDSGKINKTGFFVMVLTTFLITIADGGDNIAVYISFFTSLSGWEYGIAAAVFVILQAAFCAVAWIFVSAAPVKLFIQKSEKILVPLLFCALGIYILVEDGTALWLMELLAGKS